MRKKKSDRLTVCQRKYFPGVLPFTLSHCERWKPKWFARERNVGFKAFYRDQEIEAVVNIILNETFYKKIHEGNNPT